MKFSPLIIGSAVSLASFFSPLASAMDTLTIPAGETYTIGTDEQRLQLKTLQIGDDVTIRFAEGVRQWQLRADQAALGSNVVINAGGATGSSGDEGKDATGRAAECQDGESGSHAAAGADGKPGVSVRLQLGLSELGSLRILSNGGTGGSGGQGGDGQAAGEFSTVCKSGAEGGAAGDGGDGGNGGNAGDVTVLYWAAAQGLDLNRVPDLVEVVAEPGQAGSGGRAGTPGKGSEGRYIQKKTLTGSRAYVGSGDTGDKGRTGSQGRRGLAGRILVEQALVAAPILLQQPAVTRPGSGRPAFSKPESARQKPASSTPSRDEEIQSIKSSLKTLMERLEQLESE